MSLRKNLAALLLGSSLLGCGSKGPIVPYCISDPNNFQLRCYDPKQDKFIQRGLANVEGYTCMPGTDATSLLDACNKKIVPPQRNQCVVGSAEEKFLFHCFDQRRQESRNLNFADTDNFVCMDVNDFLFVIDYCEQKRTAK